MSGGNDARATGKKDCMIGRSGQESGVSSDLSFMLIKEIPEDERPREKLFHKGAAALSDAEILALFFSTGRAGMSAIELGREMIQRFGNLRNLSRATTAELCQIPG